MGILFEKLWHSYFKKTIDTLIDYWPDKEFFFSLRVYEVYDFIEFIANKLFR